MNRTGICVVSFVALATFSCSEPRMDADQYSGVEMLPESAVMQSDFGNIPRFDQTTGQWHEDVDGDGYADVAAPASDTPVDGAFFDSDRGVWLLDSDGDKFPDLTELFGATDPNDPDNHPPIKAETQNVGFPSSSCRSGFRNMGARLCIDTDEQGPSIYLNAQNECREKKARVCTHEDMYYLFTYGSTVYDQSYDPYGMWLGQMVSDDVVFYGNAHVTSIYDGDKYNFEGHAHKNNSRTYYCCHDNE